MRIRHVITIVLVATLLAAGWWLAAGDGGARPRLETSKARSVAPQSTPNSAAKPDLPDSGASERQAIPAPTPPAATTSPRELGTIVVLDESGVEHADESGSFRLSVIEPRRETLEVAVNNGRWSAGLAEGERFFVERIRLGGRSALQLPRSEPIVAGARAPHLLCQWPGVARLHVVDATNGVELDQLSLYRVSGWDALGVDTLSERPKSAPVAQGLTSPLEVPFEFADHDSGLPVHFVERAGYALGQIQLDPLASAESFLRLEPVGSLLLHVDTASRDARLRLKLYRERGAELELVTEWPGAQLGAAPRPSLTANDLVAGAYRIRAEAGANQPPRILAEQAFAIVAGRRTDVVLAVEGLAPTQPVEVVVTVKFGTSWSLDSFELGVYSLDIVIRGNYRKQMIRSASMTAVEPGTWTSDPIRLDPGRCRFTIAVLGFAHEVLLGAEPRQEVLVEVPAAATIIARAVDGATGEQVASASFRWGWKGPSDQRAYLSGTPPQGASPGELEFMAPCGTVEVDASAGPHSFAYQVLEVVPGINHVTLVLEPDYRLEFVLRDGDKDVPWPMSAANGFKFELVGEQTFRGMAGVSVGSGRLTLSASQAGSYRVSFPNLAGYRKVEPFEVILERGGPSERVVQLARE